MFRLADPDEQYGATVEVAVPGAEAPGRFKVRWLLLRDAEINELLAAGGEELLLRVVVGWDHVHDHAGEPIPYSEENLRLLAGLAYMRRAMVDAYVRWVAGLPAKNSATPPADGGAAAKAESSRLSPRIGRA